MERPPEEAAKRRIGTGDRRVASEQRSAAQCSAGPRLSVGMKRWIGAWLMEMEGTTAGHGDHWAATKSGWAGKEKGRRGGGCGMCRMDPGWQGWIQHRTIRTWASRKRRRAGKYLAKGAGPCMLQAGGKKRLPLAAARFPLPAARCPLHRLQPARLAGRGHWHPSHSPN